MSTTLNHSPPNPSYAPHANDGIVSVSSPSTNIQLTNYRSVAGTEGGSVLLADDSATGNTLEVRFLPYVRTDRQKERFAQQIRLISLFSSDQIRAVVGADLTSVPPKVVLSAPQESLEAYLNRADCTARWQISVELFALFFRTTNFGLLHGAPELSAISIDPQSGLLVDYLEGISRGLLSNESFSIESEIQGVLKIIHGILAPVVDSDELSQWLGQRRRAQLMQLLRVTDIVNREYLLFDQWSQLLVQTLDPEPTITPIVNGTPSASSPLPCPVGDVSSTGEIQVELNAPARSSDDTGEIFMELEQPTSTHSSPQIGTTIGRFHLEKLLGQGGMGQVFLAIDQGTQARVALKVLRPQGDVAKAIRRFRKEARLLSQLSNPNITRLIDRGQDGDWHYLALEFVDGIDLKHWLATRHEPLPEHSALQLIAEIARGLIDAHELGIIHRDIKPENVLLGYRRKSAVATPSQELDDYFVKLTDFGIARSLEQSASLEMTRQGSLLGTPLFMAPEQFKGSSELSPATDVYSLGVTLFLLLAGRPPFVSDDPMKLAAMHCFDLPPDIQKLNPLVSAETVGLLARMLLKDATQRPADAGQILVEIEQKLRGECHSAELHPRIPSHQDQQVWERTFTWDLESSAAQLWPFVANTDRLNRAMGLRAVQFRTTRDPIKGLRRFGSFHMFGTRIEWEEHPFEWIEGQRMGVLREFQTGPFRWFMSIVELQPLPQGGTRLIHTLRVEPRHWLGKLLANIEIGIKAPRALERVYRRINATLLNQSTNQLADPFELSSSPNRTTRQRIEQRLERMLSAGAAEDLANRLVEYLQSASPQDLAQIRPLELAQRFKVEPIQWIDTCLLATHCGLLKIHWEILCPTCRAASASVDLLGQIEQHTHCEACMADFRSDVATAIELVFHAHPEIRTIDKATYCIGGPHHAPHVVTQLRLEPGERLDLRLELDNGDYLLRGTKTGGIQTLQVRAQVPTTRLHAMVGNLGQSSTLQLRRGVVLLNLTNDQQQTELIRLERTIPRADVITAAQASSLARFRELFPDQIFDAKQVVTADNLILVEARLLNLDDVYMAAGDPAVYRLIQTAREQFQHVVMSAQGAFIKSDGETFLASFQDGAQAVAAAFNIIRVWQDAWTGKTTESPEDFSTVQAAIGVHRGPVLMATQNGRWDYFGATIRQTHLLPSAIDQGIVLTEAVFSDPAIEQTLLEHSDQIHSIRMFELPQQASCLLQHIVPIVSVASVSRKSSTTRSL